MQKQSRKERQQFNELHKIADSFIPKVKRAFLVAIDRFKVAINIPNLVEALSTGDISRVMNVIQLGQFAPKLQNTLSEPLRDLYIKSAQNALNQLPVKKLQHTPTVNFSFDIMNDRSVRFLQAYEFNLIRQLSTSTLNGIRQVVLNAFKEGGSPRQQARRIMEARGFGLTERQANAVDNFREMLVEDGRNAATVERQTARYYQRQLRRRATAIARTETIRAANAGQHELWRQAADDGLLDTTKIRRKWIVTRDERLSVSHRKIPGMNKKGVGLNEEFKTPEGPFLHPPTRTHCRCAVALIEVE